MHLGLQVKMDVLSSLLGFCQECYFQVIGGAVILQTQTRNNPEGLELLTRTVSTPHAASSSNPAGIKGIV
jgi:hypothetical protein